MRLMGVNSRCAKIPMGQELLDGPDVVAVFEEMGHKRVLNALAWPRYWKQRGPSGLLAPPKGRHTLSASADPA